MSGPSFRKVIDTKLCEACEHPLRRHVWAEAPWSGQTFDVCMVGTCECVDYELPGHDDFEAIVAEIEAAS